MIQMAWLSLTEDTMCSSNGIRAKKAIRINIGGLFSSDDLIRWAFHGPVLKPDQVYDRNGVYSGSALIKDDQMFLYYTGNSRIEGQRKSWQCLATSKDGQIFTKQGPVLETPDGYTEHFRDPKVYAETNGHLSMTIGGQRMDGTGAIVSASSMDGIHWKWDGELAASRAFEMIECPDLFYLDGTSVLFYGLQKRNNEKDEVINSTSYYRLENGSKAHWLKKEIDLDDRPRLIDYGFDFYAPQTFEDGKGRRILFGWMSRMNDQQEMEFGKEEPNIHCLTLPRVLNIRDGHLYQTIPEELYQLAESERLIKVNPIRSSCRLRIPQRTFLLKLKDIEQEPLLSIEWYKGDTRLVIDRDKGRIQFGRTSWINDQMEWKDCFHEEKVFELEIWSDQSSIEIFINKGKYVFSSRINPQSNDCEIIIKGIKEGSQIMLQEMKKIGEKENERQTTGTGNIEKRWRQRECNERSPLRDPA